MEDQEVAQAYVDCHHGNMGETHRLSVKGENRISQASDGKPLDRGL